ncbi:ferredoxin [Desulfonema ishimotonii]|uniref:Ferredoxin n=1 Tax=Desulfonema ishimotonii TaxID=45657 RepID=A0A401FR60_9BACT|nr:ASKHA domain-containing protein [Desulfonema ishimotonii]GBC59449.1 ferredoxin [Desulfonema ishimotonii]
MSEKYWIRFEPTGLSVEAENGSLIADVGARRNLPVRSDCGGKGVCGKCMVIAEPPENLSPPTDTELKRLNPEQIAGGYRLACQANISGPVRVTVPEQLADSREVRGKDGVRGVYAASPLTRRVFLPKAKMPDPDQGFCNSLTDWFSDRIRAAADLDIRFREPGVLRQVSLPEMCKGEATVICHAEKGVTAVLPGRRTTRLGIAFDIGTTTLAAYMCDMENGQVLTSESVVNPQRRVGEDVISRIAHTNEHKSGLADLQALIISAIDDLIGRCVEKVGAAREDVEDITIVGNTTMQQILAGIHPCGLGAMPYLPVSRAYPAISAADLGLGLNPATSVHLLPVVSGFVGGDTIGATLADGPHRRDESCLLVDIGTNGELVISNNGELWATSCATGPALEGAQISCGMRAVSGAISRVWPGDNGEILYQVMGDNGTKPLGLCGSGVIDAIAALRRAGVIEKNGRFNPDAPGVVCDEKGLGRKFVLVPGEKSGSGEEVVITLKDVRQLQLAKAALAVGIEFLMERAGIGQVDRTVLTGAFGARFDWRNAVTIGMLPPGAVAGLVEPRDNLAGVGAIMALLNRSHRAEADDICQKVRFIELAGNPDFAMRFAYATTFPDI